MKDIIILFSMVLLGLAIGGFVIGLQDSAGQITDQIKDEVTSMVTNGGA